MERDSDGSRPSQRSKTYRYGCYGARPCGYRSREDTFTNFYGDLHAYGYASPANRYGYASPANRYGYASPANRYGYTSSGSANRFSNRSKIAAAGH